MRCGHASYEYQQQIDSGRATVVGVNKYVQDEPLEIPILVMDPEGERRQMARLARIRRERDAHRHAAALARCAPTAERPDENLMPALIEAAHAYATLGEMFDVLRVVWGIYRETPVF